MLDEVYKKSQSIMYIGPFSPSTGSTRNRFPAYSIMMVAFLIYCPFANLNIPLKSKISNLQIWYFS